MNLKTTKPSLENRETEEKIENLLTYVEAMRAEIDFNFSLVSKRIKRINEAISKMKGET